MIRFALLLLVTLLLVSNLFAQPKGFDAFELTIPQLQTAMDNGQTTSKELVSQYLKRIEALDQNGARLNAMIYVNPRALEEAAALDRERTEKGPRGPLHGIPIVLKDNYDTQNMPTTAGFIAMAGFVPPDDGFQVGKLRDAGAVFIGKTNMHEFARGIETISSLGGQTLNPYDPRRNPGGSSGGTAVAVAANFAAAGMGSDTCGSVRIPAAYNNLFGIRVSQGLSSRDGIIPLSHTQDVGGPLARSVIDLATMLDATVGTDPADKQTVAATGHIPGTYLDFLNVNGLEGARLGLLSEYVQKDAPFGEVSRVFQEAVAVMMKNGAEVIHFDIDGLDELLKNTNVIDLEFKFDLETYLQQSEAPVKSLSDILQSGLYHEALDERYRRSNAVEANSGKYLERLENRVKLARLLDDVMTSHNLDALVYPTIRVKPAFVGEDQFGSVCWIAAHSGFPAITMPAGFTGDLLPVGIELLARPFQEGRLVELAYAFEHISKPRRSPFRTPSLISDVLSYHFKIHSPQVTGSLYLDRPSQTLHYNIRVQGVSKEDIKGIRIHRGTADTNGPVIELLGTSTEGVVSIRNSYLTDLLAGNLQMVIYTRDAQPGSIRGPIRMIEPDLHPE